MILSNSLMKNIFCFIPAKYASTRLAHKNVLKLNGKEMMGYAIEEGHKSEMFDEIIVSTESSIVSDVALKFNAKSLYLRDEKLAVDPAGIVDVLLDFFDKFPTYKNYNEVAIILPTAPLILAEDIVKAIELFRQKDCKYLMSVTEDLHNAHRSVYVEDEKLVPMFPDLIRKKSQELKSSYRLNGAITIVNVNDFLKTKDYFTFPICVYPMPQERSIDVDTLFDFKMAEMMLIERD